MCQMHGSHRQQPKEEPGRHAEQHAVPALRPRCWTAFAHRSCRCLAAACLLQDELEQGSKHRETSTCAAPPVLDCMRPMKLLLALPLLPNGCVSVPEMDQCMHSASLSNK